jgi:hypothetical protein
MKKLLLNAIWAFSINAFSQPILTENAFLPIGTQMTINVHSGAISPGGSGTNQTWNLSGLTSNNVGQFTMVNPSSTACANQFPSSNYAITIPNGDVLYYVRSSSQLELTGHSYPNCMGSIVYSDNMIEYKFPFSYLDSITDTYTNIGGSGTATYVYDGYGTLITPFGTFNNVGRIKSTIDNQTEYAWFTGTTFQYLVARTINNNTSTLLYSNVMANVENKTFEPQVLIYPNPANNEVSITNIPIGSTLCITDITGKTIYSLAIRNEQTTIRTTDFENGVYFLQVMNNGRMANKKLIISRQ